MKNVLIKNFQKIFKKNFSKKFSKKFLKKFSKKFSKKLSKNFHLHNISVKWNCILLKSFKTLNYKIFKNI